MTRFIRWCATITICGLLMVSPVGAATDSWLGGSGFWTNLPFPNPPVPLQSTWWNLLHPPGSSDGAMFNTAGINNVTINGSTAAFQELYIAAGNDTFVSDGG